MAIIELKDISKSYRTVKSTVHALRDVCLSIDRGDFVCVAGPSGSGKSTLLHLAGTLDNPSSGQVIINGRKTAGFSRTAAALFRRQNIGFIFQKFNLIPVLTAFENVEFILSLLNIPATKRKKSVEKTLDAFGLSDFMHHRAGELSSGQQQRVAAARAIVANPLIILADEPTASLDSETGMALIDLFSEINKREKTTFLFSSHDPRIINRASRILNLRDGIIAREENPVPLSRQKTTPPDCSP
jgi:putative ABC transport system ATP-binding protein